MSKKQQDKKHGGARKIGRKKRAINQAMSAYARGKISFENYRRQTKSK
jgi:uncharacterized membrane protein